MMGKMMGKRRRHGTCLAEVIMRWPVSARTPTYRRVPSGRSFVSGRDCAVAWNLRHKRRQGRGSGIGTRGESRGRSIEPHAQ